MRKFHPMFAPRNFTFIGYNRDLCPPTFRHPPDDRVGECRPNSVKSCHSTYPSCIVTISFSSFFSFRSMIESRSKVPRMVSRKGRSRNLRNGYKCFFFFFISASDDIGDWIFLWIDNGRYCHLIIIGINIWDEGHNRSKGSTSESYSTWILHRVLMASESLFRVEEQRARNRSKPQQRQRQEISARSDFWNL